MEGRGGGAFNKTQVEFAQNSKKRDTLARVLFESARVLITSCS